MDSRLTVYRVVPTGLTTAYTAGVIAGTADMVFKNDGRTKIHFKKSGAGACTVTVRTPGKQAGLDIADQSITVPASTGDIMGGPFPPNTYCDGNGDTRIALSEVTGLTLMCFTD